MEKGGLGQFADLRGVGLARGVVFLRGAVDTPMYTMKTQGLNVYDLLGVKVIIWKEKKNKKFTSFPTFTWIAF